MHNDRTLQVQNMCLDITLAIGGLGLLATTFRSGKWLRFRMLDYIVLQLIRREQYFGGLLLLTTFGFALTFGVLNADGLIVRQNVARARAGVELDSRYLIGLSDDALPVLVAEYQLPGQPESIRKQLGAVLSCRLYAIAKADQQQPAWQSYHLGEAAARQAVQGLDLSSFAVQTGSQGMHVLYEQEELNCYPKRSLD